MDIIIIKLANLCYRCIYVHSLPFDSIFPSSVPADCVSNYKYEQENVLE